MKTIPYGRQSIDDDDIQSVVDVLKSDWLTQGPRVETFEKAIADYCGARYAVACSSGTAALHLAYLAAGIGPEDVILTSPITFVATSNAALYVGAKPFFADIDPATYNIDPLKMEAALFALESKKANVKAIVPVHFAGLPCEMEAIGEIAKRRRLLVVEDACHAIGSTYSGKKIGGLSDLTVFSFHPVKTITTGEGGAVATNDRELYNRLKRFRTHGITKEGWVHGADGPWYYEMQSLGFNYRMTDLQAALGIAQIKKLDRFVEKRRAIAKRYRDAFQENSYFDLPSESENARSSYHLFPIRLKDRAKEIKEKIFLELTAQGLGVQVHYIPVYWHPFYQKMGYERGLCPVAEDFYRREISIPMYPAMGDDDIAFVIKTVKRVFNALC